MTGSQHKPSSAVEGFKFPWPFPEKPSTFYKVKSYMTMAFVQSLARTLFAFGANKIRVDDRERLMKALRNETRPLITMCNHRSNIDDPLIYSLFSWPWHTTLFSLGRCVPCVRGDGVFQPGMDFCLRRLNERMWVHIFPEGRVTEKPLRFKWGIGRLVLESREPPLVLPIWTKGMNTVWPNQPPYYPKFGNHVDVFVGEVIDTRPLVEAQKGKEEIKARKAITDSLQGSFFDLGLRCGGINKEEAEQVRALK